MEILSICIRPATKLFSRAVRPVRVPFPSSKFNLIWAGPRNMMGRSGCYGPHRPCRRISDPLAPHQMAVLPQHARLASPTSFFHKPAPEQPHSHETPPNGPHSSGANKKETHPSPECKPARASYAETASLATINFFLVSRRIVKAMLPVMIRLEIGCQDERKMRMR